MDEKKKKYKRVKKTIDCANPLFEKWIKEWYDEATKRGWKSQYIYGKALGTLKKYPLPLRSGKEAKILEFFGDKMCLMLDDKLQKYIADGGEIQNHENNVDIDKSNEESESDSQVNNNLRPPARKQRQYVPAVRSGPYALLLTLYKNHQLHGNRACMKKEALMDEAQPLCDKSFRVPEPGSFYTAWSSMGLLVKKGLVIKESSPAKYYLTESGFELAERLDQAENQPNPVPRKNRVVTQRHEISFSSESDEENHDSSSPISSEEIKTQDVRLNAGTSSTKFVYCYVTEDGKEIHEKDKAFVSIDDAMIGFLIKCRKDSLLASGRCFKIDQSRSSPNDEYVYAFLHNNHADDFVTPSSSDLVEDFSDVGSSSVASSDVGQFVLNSGQFEIVLCVDNCETVAGEVNSRKLQIQHDLRKNGVIFDVRKLHVGDYLWIAREKVTSLPGQLRLPTRKELVLDYIVERKRMDDLASSIKDGRFHEQKFRLKECGLGHPIYLVEEMSGGSVTSLPQSSLNQAIANTQIIDGFMIKRTLNNSASVAYLTLMTRYLESFYSKKNLICVPKDKLKAKDESCGLNGRCKLMTFEEFNSSSIKNREMTVKDLFVKQLLQLNGLSVDKAVAIIDRYSTPASLIEALNSCETIKEKEKLLANLKCGKLKRNLGPSISKLLYQLYCNPVLR